MIGFLTILGYSLYDTVVVFDRLKEHGAGLRQATRQTYARRPTAPQPARWSGRINTSMVALLPVGGDPVHRRRPAGRGAR